MRVLVFEVRVQITRERLIYVGAGSEKAARQAGVLDEGLEADVVACEDCGSYEGNDIEPEIWSRRPSARRKTS